MKYHVNNETGKYGQCSAEKGKCPFIGDSVHVESLKEAKSVAEKILSNKYETTPTLKKESVRTNSSSMFDTELYRNVRKMPALFVIDRGKHLATTELNSSADWIFEEETKPTYKRDGTSITVDENGKVWARRSVRKGKKAPANYMEAEVDPITGHSFGLEPIEQSSFKKFYDEAEGNFDGALEPGTYELCGPKVQNAEGLDDHRLLRHGEDIAEEIPDMRNVPKDEAFEMLKNIFADYKQRGIEGVVWWGKDGKRTKLRVKDFFGDPNRR